MARQSRDGVRKVCRRPGVAGSIDVVVIERMNAPALAQTVR
jgi:hypothetical protein